MSALKVTQIKHKLLQLFEKHLDLSDIAPKDLEREPKVLSRCLAALAVMLESGCSAQEAAAAVWDGGDDDGIDAAFFDASESRVVLVQSKWIFKGSGEPEAKEIGAFTKGVMDIIEQDATQFHPRLQIKLTEIFSRIAVPGTSVRLVVVSTGASALAKHGTDVLDTLLTDLNGDDPAAIASSVVLGLTEVYGGLANDPAQATVSLDATLYDWSYVAQPYPAYFGVIDGAQLKTWWSAHGKRVVSANIRHALGATEVNNEIKGTATATPESFWYFNNGITLTAEDVAKAPANAGSHTAGHFQFKAASIVNGAQTVSSLGSVADDSSLGKVRVSIRVILLKSAPDGFGADVTRTNNLQNRVEPRDFAAQDPEQVRLRQEMALEDVEYQIVRSIESAPAAASCELTEVTTALACANGDPTLAVQAKTGLGRFYLDLAKAPYKTLFNPTTTGARAFNAVLLQREIDAWIESKKVLLGKKRSGPEWGVLIHGNRLLAACVFAKVGAGALNTTIAAFRPALSGMAVSATCDQVYAGMVAKLKFSFQGKWLAVLFKNPTLSRQVFDAATK